MHNLNHCRARERALLWLKIGTATFGTARNSLCAAAFALHGVQVQSKTLGRVALELRGTRTTVVQGKAVPSQCDPYSLYVQLSRCPSLDGVMLLSRARERDIVGNTVPENEAAAEKRLVQPSEATVTDAENWDW